MIMGRILDVRRGVNSGGDFGHCEAVFVGVHYVSPRRFIGLYLMVSRCHLPRHRWGKGLDHIKIRVPSPCLIGLIGCFKAYLGCIEGVERRVERRVRFIYGVYMVYIWCIYGVYTCITGAHRCMYGYKGVYRVYKGYIIWFEGSHTSVAVRICHVARMQHYSDIGVLLNVVYLYRIRY